MTLYQPPQDVKELVLAWLRRARESQMAHYEMANVLSRRSQWLGVPVILITAIVGTSVFASIAAEPIAVEAKVVVGLLSVFAAVLSSLQTFFKFSERAEKHRAFAARYGAVRREIEALFAEGVATQEKHYVGVSERSLIDSPKKHPMCRQESLWVRKRNRRAEVLHQVKRFVVITSISSRTKQRSSTDHSRVNETAVLRAASDS